MSINPDAWHHTPEVLGTAQPLTTESLQQSIHDSVAREAKRLQEKAIKVAVHDFEQELRAAVGAVACKVSNFFSIQSLANEMVIHIKIDKEGK